MTGVTKVQLYLLRAMYLLIAVGLGLTIWPAIMAPAERVADSHSVIQSILGAFSLLAFVGLRYPLQMLPILIFELVWKTMWVLFYALPVWLHTGLDEYATGVVFACAMGIVLTPVAIPWRYLYRHYWNEFGVHQNSRYAKAE